MSIRNELTESQEHLVMEWAEINGIDMNTLEIPKADWLNGFSVVGRKINDKSGEWWGIDFVYKQEGKNE